MYATEQDLDAGWDLNTVNLVSIDDGATERNPVRIAAALAAATSMMDSYFGQRYPLPLDMYLGEWPPLLTATCADLAIGRLADSVGRLTEIIKSRRDAAMQWLRDVAAGKAGLPLPPGPGAPGAPAMPAITPNEAVIEAPPRLFTRHSLRSM